MIDWPWNMGKTGMNFWCLSIKCETWEKVGTCLNPLKTLAFVIVAKLPFQVFEVWKFTAFCTATSVMATGGATEPGAVPGTPLKWKSGNGWAKVGRMLNQAPTSWNAWKKVGKVQKFVDKNLDCQPTSQKPKLRFSCVGCASRTCNLCLVLCAQRFSDHAGRPPEDWNEVQGRFNSIHKLKPHKDLWTAQMKSPLLDGTCPSEFQTMQDSSMVQPLGSCPSKGRMTFILKNQWFFSKVKPSWSLLSCC